MGEKERLKGCITATYWIDEDETFNADINIVHMPNCWPVFCAGMAKTVVDFIDVTEGKNGGDNRADGVSGLRSAEPERKD